MKRTNIILTIIIAISILILALLLAITYNNIQTYNSSTVFLKSMLDFTSNNNEEIFTIDKITFFSSSDAEISTNSNSVFTISNLYQFTDIALFISPVKEDFTQKNTIKSVQIEQIKFSTMPDIGTPNLYYKNINNFSTPKYEKENLITDSLTFETTSENTLENTNEIYYAGEYTHSNHILSTKGKVRSKNADVMDRMEKAESLIKENIEYELLIERYPFKENKINEIIDIMVEAIVLEQDLKLKDNVIPYQLLRSRFEKYNFFTMQYLLETLGNTTNKVNNPKKYLLVALYNAPITMDNYYEFEVNHDMNKWEGRD